MGEIVVEVALENQEDRTLARRGYLDESEVRRTRIPAIADTGAMMLALPENVVTELGLDEVGSYNATYANGASELLAIAGSLVIQIGDRSMQTECVVLPNGAEALVGAIVMERLDLIADSKNQTLHPRPESPDFPMGRL